MVRWAPPATARPSPRASSALSTVPASFADRLLAADAREAGVNVVSGGTDVHLVLVDLRDSTLDGKQAEDRLHNVGITVNRNAVPFDPRPPMVSSGVRIGTPALAARGFGSAEFAEVAEVAEIIAQALRPDATGEDLRALRGRVTALAAHFPLYPELADPELTEAAR
jgi:glycine hydroxymethyltransferase